MLHSVAYTSFDENAIYLFFAFLLFNNFISNNPIIGKSVWDIWTGNSNHSPHEAYYFYYHVNELHDIRYGKWKMYFPHKYRTLNGRKGGENGLPVEYEYNTIDQIQLYDLSKDIGETLDVAAENPEIAAKIEALGDKMRTELDDVLIDKVGKGTKSIGKIE